jgi:hypothetical protein
MNEVFLDYGQRVVEHLEFGFVVDFAVVASVRFLGNLDYSVLGANIAIARRCLRPSSRFFYAGHAITAFVCNRSVFG